MAAPGGGEEKLIGRGRPVRREGADGGRQQQQRLHARIGAALTNKPNKPAKQTKVKHTTRSTSRTSWQSPRRLRRPSRTAAGGAAAAAAAAAGAAAAGAAAVVGAGAAAGAAEPVAAPAEPAAPVAPAEPAGAAGTSRWTAVAAVGAAARRRSAGRMKILVKTNQVDSKTPSSVYSRPTIKKKNRATSTRLPVRSGCRHLAAAAAWRTVVVAVVVAVA